MDRWEESILMEMKKMKVEVYLFTKYVDDVTMALSVIPKGWRWKNCEGEWRLEWEQEQQTKDESV